MADRAYALSSPITIQFTGDVSGSATFDGSKNVISSLSLTGEGDTGNSVQGVGSTTVVMATPSFTVPEGGTWFVCPVKENCGIMRGSNFYEYLENVASGTALTHGQRLFNADSGRNELRTLAGSPLWWMSLVIRRWGMCSSPAIGPIRPSGSPGGQTYRLGIPRPDAPPKVKVKVGGGIGDLSVFGFAAKEGEAMPTANTGQGLATIGQQNVRLAPVTFSTIEGFPEEDDPEDVSRSSAYCYTYVQNLMGGVYQQESAPSPPSELLDVRVGDGVDVSGFSRPSLPGLNITHIRIYRTVSGNTSADFRFVVEIPVGRTSYLDATHDKDISPEVLQTSLWDMIPDDARGLIKTDNGIYAAFRGNELLISELFVPYAYPESYRLTVEDRIVALAHVDGTIVALTTGRPYLAQGAAPESLQLMHLPIEQPCLSAQSVASLAGGVVYACPDGLMLFTSSEQSLTTATVFTCEQWQALGPEKLIGSVCEGRYVGFFRDTNTGIMLDMGRRDIVRLEFPAGLRVRCVHHHVNDDCLYLGCSDGGVYKFEAGQHMPYRWRSKPFFTSALTAFNCLRVEGEQDRNNSVQVKLFGPDRVPRKRPILCTVKDTRTQRIPVRRSEKEWAVELSGTAAVYEVRVGSSVEDLEYGN